MIAIGITATPVFIRLTRGQTMGAKVEDYVEAARAVDAGAIARQCAGEVEAIKARLHEARVRAVAHALGR